MQITQTTIQFPDIKLVTRDGHKLRGYFGDVFKEHSPLLHNHFDDGQLRYAYPLVQYKVIDEVPMLTGFGEGAELLVKLFLEIREIDLGGKKYPVYAKNIRQQNLTFTEEEKLIKYGFKTLWLPLNQQNYQKYKAMPAEEQKIYLDNMIVNNMLSFYKGIGYRVSKKILGLTELKEGSTQFKNQVMTAFSGSFVTNVFIPDYAGIGKAVSRGFGTVVKINSPLS